MTRIFVGLCIAVCAPLLSVYILRHKLAAKAPPGQAARAPAAAPRAPEQAPEASVIVPAVEERKPDADPAGRRHAVHELSDSLCPAAMALVVGDACGKVDQTCLHRARGGPCEQFEEAPPCRGRERLAFCIDPYEYPAVEGALPAMMLTFEQAEMACEHEGKRLCTDQEWSLACEGRSHAPYAYGFALEPERCNVGPRSGGKVPVRALWQPRDRAALVAKLDARWPSGSGDCVSDFGVADLLGNVREWVRVAPDGETPGGLKGGDFTSGAATCRFVRRIGRRHYAAFAVGARCCAEPLAPIPREVSPARGPAGAVALPDRFD